MPMLSSLIGLHHRATPIGIVIDEVDHTFALAEEAIIFYHGYADLEVERILERLGINIDADKWSYDSKLELVSSKSDADIEDSLERLGLDAGIKDWIKSRSYKKEATGNKFDIWLSHSEWAIIKPLFYLYIERENALHLEASRVLGVDVYGRSVSEVKGDIANYHDQMHLKAFHFKAFTI